jgi:hypothetical protein
MWRSLDFVQRVLWESILESAETNRISLSKDAAMNVASTSLNDPPVQGRERLLASSLPSTFRWLWGGQAISLTGSQLSLLSFQLIAANLLHASAMDMGILTAVQTAPYILCGLFVGTGSDLGAVSPYVVTAAEMQRSPSGGCFQWSSASG